MNCANSEIRKYAKEKKVAFWMIGNHLGVSEMTISRWLRVELEPAKKKYIQNAIDEIAFHNNQCL